MNLKVIKSIKLIAVLFSGAFLLLGSATVDAGADKTINEGESVTLDGSKSTADDGAAITAYTWSENGTVYCQNSQICTIDNLSAGIHHITLTMTQSNGQIFSDDVTVTVNQTMETIGQAIMGPISKGDFRIEKLSDHTLIAEGKTTEGDGANVNSAGLIKVSQSVAENLVSGYYVVTVTGGSDIDKDDNNVWDTTPTPNHGTLHALLTDTQIQDGDFRVTVLTEVVYQSVQEIIADGGNIQKDLLEEEISNRMTWLLKEASNGGDIDGDGDIDSDDMLQWNPATDYGKLRTGNEEKLSEIAQKVLNGEDVTQDAFTLVIAPGSAPVANDMNVTVRENKTKQLTLNASDPDGDALTYTIVTPPAHGKLSGTAPDLTYTPDKDYPGDDSFTYKVNDGSEDSNIATVSIDIKGYRLVEKTTLTDELEYVKYTYDSMGRLIKKEEGERIGGSEYIDRLEEYTNTYDAQGNLKRRDIDRGGDGTVDGYESFTYDDQGRVLTRFSHNTQFTNPGYYEYTYDTQGHLLTEKDDYQADGDFEYKRVYTYDAQGRVIKKTYDYNYDGTIDDTYTYSYIDASDGGYTKITHDSDASYLFIEKYDANGNITESGYGNENGEITDDVEYSVYTWIEI